MNTKVRLILQFLETNPLLNKLHVIVRSNVVKMNFISLKKSVVSAHEAKILNRPF